MKGLMHCSWLWGAFRFASVNAEWGSVGWRSHGVVEVRPYEFKAALESSGNTVADHSMGIQPSINATRTIFLVLHYAGFCVLPYFSEVAEKYMSLSFPNIKLRFLAINCEITLPSVVSYCEGAGGSTYGRHSTSTFDVRMYIIDDVENGSSSDTAIQFGADVESIFSEGGSLRLPVGSKRDLDNWIGHFFQTVYGVDILAALMIDNSTPTGETAIDIEDLWRQSYPTFRKFPSYNGFYPSIPDVSSAPEKRLADAEVGLHLAYQHVAWQAITPGSAGRRLDHATAFVAYSNGTRFIPQDVVDALHDFLEIVVSLFPTVEARESARRLLTFIKPFCTPEARPQSGGTGTLVSRSGIAESGDGGGNLSSLSSDLYVEHLKTVMVEGSNLARIVYDNRYRLQHCSSSCCAFHQIFHILMVATVELPIESDTNEGMHNDQDLPNRFSPKEVLRRIVYNFIGKMFFCKCCSDPYLEVADAIGFQSFDDADGIGANYWLWRMHNNLTMRLAVQGKRVGDTTLWPPASECPDCYPTDGCMLNQFPHEQQACIESASATAIYRHLRNVYWKTSHSAFPKAPYTILICLMGIALFVSDLLPPFTVFL
jgi:hypothetical protein